MGNFTIMAGVSRTLRTLLRDRMEDPVSVTLAPPDSTITGITARRLNLYLYLVKENGALKNQEIPGEGHPSAYGHPPLSLDLDYLLTAYGPNETTEDADLDAQQILGDAMRVVHDHAIIGDSLEITRPLAGNVGDPILHSSLLSEFERIKLSLEPLALDDFSKIWSALPKANFRRSIAYKVTVVQIESRLPRAQALPVRAQRVYAVPFASPHIAEAFREPPIEGFRVPIVEVGETLRLRGRNFAGQNTRVRLGGQLLTPAALTDTELDVVVPSTLTAGLHPMQVVRDLMLEVVPGQPPVAHRGFESNLLAVSVIPRMTAINPASAGAGANVTVTVTPLVGAKQAVGLLLGDTFIPRNFVAPDSPPAANLVFTLPTGAEAISPGNYFRRVRVDGAESRLTFNPVTKQYTGPLFTVT